MDTFAHRAPRAQAMAAVDALDAHINRRLLQASGSEEQRRIWCRKVVFKRRCRNLTADQIAAAALQELKFLQDEEAVAYGAR